MYVCPGKKLTNHLWATPCKKKSCKEVEELRQSEMRDKKHHWPQLRARIRRLWFWWWKRAKNYVQHHRQFHKCKTSTPTVSPQCEQLPIKSTISAIKIAAGSHSSLTIKSQQIEQARIFWLSLICSEFDPYFCWRQRFTELDILKQNENLSISLPQFENKMFIKLIGPFSWFSDVAALNRLPSRVNRIPSIILPGIW